MFAWTIGRKVMDARLLSTAGKLLASCAAVVVLDRACVAMGPPRLVLDAVAYCALAIGSGAVRIRELREFASAARKSRSGSTF
jgi:hypothetical protein